MGEKIFVTVEHPNPEHRASLPPELWRRAKEKASKLLSPQPEGTFLKLLLWSGIGNHVCFKAWWQEYGD